MRFTGFALAAALVAIAVPALAQSTLNGPTPRGGVAPAAGGGTALGAAQLNGSFNADGTEVVSAGVASSTLISTGVYEVIFRRNISSCVWTGTIGLGGFSGSTAPSFISVTGRAGTKNGVFVQTWNLSGTPTNLPFSLHISCS